MWMKILKIRIFEKKQKKDKQTIIRNLLDFFFVNFSFFN